MPYSIYQAVMMAGSLTLLSTSFCTAAPIVAFGDFEGSASAVFAERSTSFLSESDLPASAPWVGRPLDSGGTNGFRWDNNDGTSGSNALRNRNDQYSNAANKFFYSTYQFIDTGNVTGAFDLSWDYRRLIGGQSDGDPIAANANFINVSVIGIDDTDAGSDWTVAAADRVFNVEYFETSSAIQASRNYVATGANVSQLASGGVGLSELDNEWYTNTITFNLDSTIDQIAIAIDISQPTNHSNVISYIDNVSLSSATAVPEPSSLAAFGIVSVLIGYRRRKR